MNKLLCVLSIIGSIGYISASAQQGPLKAIAVLKSDTVNGNVTLTQNSVTEPLQIEVSLVGLSPGYHGFHVHQKGDLSGGCASTGGHYNPDGNTHGDINDKIRHVGDWANIEAGLDGVANTKFTDTVATLYGERSILGRAIVVHEKIDDLGRTDHADSKSTGNAGGRLACGVIGILQPYEAEWPSGSGSTRTISSYLIISLSFIVSLKLMFN
uniref:Superoxide dismutase [Cu-Zn] n=1 Tax=Culicoides sonorensis TaxID=179676 RepID=A0A336M130_CULSO